MRLQELRSGARCNSVHLSTPLTLTFWRCVLPVLSAVLLLALPRPALAAVVVGTGTPGSCTEAALNAALTSAAKGTLKINFDCGPNPVTITLTNPLIPSRDTTVNGDDVITLSGGNTTQIVQVPVGVEVTLRNLTLRDGRVREQLGVDNGGAIANAGTLSVQNCSITGNFVDHENSQSFGGGIYNTGSLDIENSSVTNNGTTSKRENWGGGIYNVGDLEIRNSFISNNRVSSGYAPFCLTAFGGGIYNSGSLEIKNSFITTNSAIRATCGTASGGGIYNIGSLDIKNSSVTANSATSSGGAFATGGGIYNVGKLTGKNTIVANNIPNDIAP